MKFVKSCVPFTQECFVPSLVLIGPVVEEEDENVKSLKTDGPTTGDQKSTERPYNFAVIYDVRTV